MIARLRLTKLEAISLIERLKKCEMAIFGMEIPSGRIAPFYVAAFALSGNTSYLTDYYTFDQISDLAHEANVIFRLAEKFLRNNETAHFCDVPLPLNPPTHLMVDVEGRECEVLSSPAVSHTSTCSGVALFLSQSSDSSPR